jgi:hypothetical protein
LRTLQPPEPDQNQVNGLAANVLVKEAGRTTPLTSFQGTFQDMYPFADAKTRLASTNSSNNGNGNATVTHSSGSGGQHQHQPPTDMKTVWDF